ncbi:hypothetical protein ISF_07307 [Cordyceps fumosorosea ARSEF 2679]|uniref:Uncharacterized protein n=1 Tax=Cordyceps fumosorosea (strain ARSEF 2679) TaxID=1081104 RepID=A0A167PLQ9_CORFA|nr:hypothetical protein ISF_07307 [Cordyceps fumosorosea ARSEF 2679]OAA56791.1 hypothetical protein ISF_07307 [Cordyceps fumosorosea ARSEF 2679]
MGDIRSYFRTTCYRTRTLSTNFYTLVFVYSLRDFMSTRPDVRLGEDARGHGEDARQDDSTKLVASKVREDEPAPDADGSHDDDHGDRVVLRAAESMREPTAISMCRIWHPTVAHCRKDVQALAGPPEVTSPCLATLSEQTPRPPPEVPGRRTSLREERAALRRGCRAGTEWEADRRGSNEQRNEERIHTI